MKLFQKKDITPEAIIAQGKPIYCSDCRYFQSVGDRGFLSFLAGICKIKDLCFHPQNITTTKTPQEEIKGTKRYAEEINADNRCEWFRKKGPDWSRIISTAARTLMIWACCMLAAQLVLALIKTIAASKGIK